MKFVEGKTQDAAARLNAISIDKGYNPNHSVQSTSAEGFRVHDDVADAYAAGGKGTLSVTHQADQENPLRISFDAVPTGTTTFWDFGDGTTASQMDSHTVHYYLEPGTYTVKADAPGREQWQGAVAVAQPAEKKAPRRTRRTPDKEAHDGD